MADEDVQAQADLLVDRLESFVRAVLLDATSTAVEDALPRYTEREKLSEALQAVVFGREGRP